LLPTQQYLYKGSSSRDGASSKSSLRTSSEISFCGCGFVSSSPDASCKILFIVVEDSRPITTSGSGHILVFLYAICYTKARRKRGSDMAIPKEGDIVVLHGWGGVIGKVVEYRDGNIILTWP